MRVVVVRGDDFTFSNTKKKLEDIKNKIKEWYDITDRGNRWYGDIGRSTCTWIRMGLVLETEGRRAVA